MILDIGGRGEVIQYQYLVLGVGVGVECMRILCTIFQFCGGPKTVLNK